jgi:hypothetical protein
MAGPKPAALPLGDTPTIIFLRLFYDNLKKIIVNILDRKGTFSAEYYLYNSIPRRTASIPVINAIKSAIKI